MKPTTLATRIRLANSTLLAKGKLKDIAAFFTTDYVVHFSHAAPARGHAVIREALGRINAAFPRLRVKVEILVESGKRIACLRTLSGVQKGPYKGFPAGNRRIVWRELVTSEFREGLIAEEWIVTDLAEQLLLSRKRRG
jgi:predicted ester cyclase